MKRIVIKRIELTTYSKIVELSDEEANALLTAPSANTQQLSKLCRATPANWMDADDAEYEVEEDES